MARALRTPHLTLKPAGLLVRAVVLWNSPGARWGEGAGDDLRVCGTVSWAPRANASQREPSAALGSAPAPRGTILKVAAYIGMDITSHQAHLPPAYVVRDCAVSDPAGNMVRIQELG